MDYSDVGIHKKDIRFKNNPSNNSFIEKYNNGILKIRDFDKLKTILTEVYHEVKNNNGGNVADYIPQLENVDSDLFGIVLVTVDGQVIELECLSKILCSVLLKTYKLWYRHRYFK